MTEHTTSQNGDSKERIVDEHIVDEHIVNDGLLHYLQGELELPEMEAFEASAAHDPEQAETVLAYSSLLNTLTHELRDSAMPPPEDLRARVMSITAQKPISYVIRAQEGDWIDSGMTGFEFKLLFQDPETKKSTVLARIAAGARMPHHRHRGLEECLIVEGSLWTDGVLLLPGDFIVTEDTTEHEDTWSPNGALALIKTYLLDETLG